MASPPPDDAPLPRGVGRVPQWWMDITPHDTLDIEEDERRRQREYEEAQMYAQLAAEADFAQQYGEGGMDYDPNAEGAGGREGGSGVGGKSGWGGYQRGPDGKWMTPGAGRDGRQFKAGQAPDGYVPGQHNGYYSPSRFMYGQGGLRSGGGYGGDGPPGSPSDLRQTDYKYGRDANTQWEKPAWMQVKLRSTNAGSAIRSGGSVRVGGKAATRPIGPGKSPLSPKSLRPTPKRGEAETPQIVPSNQESLELPVLPPAPAPEPASAPATDPATDYVEGGPEGGPPREGIGRLVKKIRRKKVKKRRPKTRADGGEEGEEEEAADPAHPESAPVPMESAPAPQPAPIDDLLPPDVQPSAESAPAPAPKAKPAWATARRAQVSGGDGNGGAPESAPASAQTFTPPAPVPADSPAPVLKTAPAPAPLPPPQFHYPPEEEEYIEEIIEDSDGEYIEEIIVENNDGEEVIDDHVSTPNATDLQKALTREEKANEIKLTADT